MLAEGLRLVGPVLDCGWADSLCKEGRGRVLFSPTEGWVFVFTAADAELSLNDTGREGRQQVQSSEINYHIYHVPVAKIEATCVMNQSRKGLWCVMIGSPSSRWPSLSSRGLCVRSL